MKPTKHELIKYYDDRYRRNKTSWESDERDRLMYKHVRDEPHGTILDVGSGTGHSLKILYRRFGDASEYHALDLSDEALKLAKAKIPHLITHQGFVESLDLDLFDLVLCMGTAEHFIDLEVGLAKLKNISRTLYLEVPNCLAYSPGDQSFRKTAIGSHQYEWHLPRDIWEQIILGAGFEIKKEITGPIDSCKFIWLLTTSNRENG